MSSAPAAGQLLYITIARAQDNLHLLVPHSFFTHGRSAQGRSECLSLAKSAELAAIMQRFDGYAAHASAHA
jgi:hypothetical protein